MSNKTIHTGEEFILKAKVLDTGKPPRPFTRIPEGASLTWESSNPTIASIEPQPDGMRVLVNSDDVGVATITATPGGIWAHLPVTSYEVEVVNTPDASGIELEGEAATPEETTG